VNNSFESVPEATDQDNMRIEPAGKSYSLNILAAGMMDRRSFMDSHRDVYYSIEGMEKRELCNRKSILLSKITDTVLGTNFQTFLSALDCLPG